MCIKREIEEFRKLGIRLNNLSQLPNGIKIQVVDLKEIFKSTYKYEPSIKECLYLLMNDKVIPDTCINYICDNIAMFNIANNQYKYCSRFCSDNDPIRNSKIQDCRKGKIDYKAVHEKVVATKNNTICPITGLNTHMLAAKKIILSREESGLWLESVKKYNSSISRDERIRRRLLAHETMMNDIDDNGHNAYERSTKKRFNTINKMIDNGVDYYGDISKKATYTKINTILPNGLSILENSVLKYHNTMKNRYGGLHPSAGGFSPLRNVIIKGVNYKIQGYEYIEIYNLIYEKGIEPCDIIPLNCKNIVSIPYEFEGKIHIYHPDIYIISLDCYIEVKSSYWLQKEYDKSIAKLNSAIDQGYKIVLSVYTEDDKKDVKRIRNIIKRDQST